MTPSERDEWATKGHPVHIGVINSVEQLGRAMADNPESFEGMARKVLNHNGVDAPLGFYVREIVLYPRTEADGMRLPMLGRALCVLPDSP